MKTVALGTLSYALLAVASGFALSLAARSVRRRRLTVRRAVIIGGTLGLISPVVSLFVAAFLTPLTLPLLRTGHWAGAILFYAPGGVVLGALAIAIAY
jgi:hypothetical protein